MIEKIHIASRILLALVVSFVALSVNSYAEVGVGTVRRVRIDWEFRVHAEPDFRSEAVSAFAPQYVRVIEDNGGGWGKIHTDRGEYWVYLRGNRRFINRSMGLFSEKGGDRHISVIRPQVVNVLYQYGNWLQIQTWLGPKWIYLDFMPPDTELRSLMRRFENTMAVYYKNIETGFVFEHNSDRRFFSASVTKAPFALYIFDKAERGEIDLDSTVTFQGQDFHGGSGVIQHRYSVGTEITQMELLRLNLSESDNIATLMLRRFHGISGYRQFIESIGGNPSFVGNRIFDSRLTANEAGIFAKAIHRYVESGGKYSEDLKNHLRDNQFPFIVSDYPVASKTGWTQGIAWHDMAIVNAPSPYILVILTERIGWTYRDYRDFEEISMAFQQFNGQF